MANRPSEKSPIDPGGEPTPAQAPAADYAAAGTTASQPGALYVLGILFLAIAVAGGLMLVLESIGGISLPGCGEGSACTEAVNSKWGKLPIAGDFEWPVSFLGFAYFVGAFIAWLGSRRGVTPLFRNIVRLGALISLGFVLVIFIEDHHCSYCLASHAGNFGFWIVTEKSRRAPATSWQPAVTITLLFIVSSAVLGAAKWREQKTVEAKLEQQLAASTVEIIAATTQKAALIAEATPDSPTPIQQNAEAAKTINTTKTAKKAKPATLAQATGMPETSDAPESAEATRQGIQRPWEGGFRGRYLLGPDKAPVRLVMLTDYQCKDCNRIEDEVREMMNQRDDVSLSIKLFPMSTDCNPDLSRNMHPNACWAARAAYAAGILGGNDAFWEMHFWLFDHQGSFTANELREGLLDMGYDPDEFTREMTGARTLKLVQSDIEEGRWLGLHFTPMVFINGVELKGVFARNAVPRAVARIAAGNPPPMTHDHDQPPPAAEKCVADWRDGRTRRLPQDRYSWPRGPDDAKVKIVMWADYQERYTRMADRIISQWMAGRPDVQYTFRHFPFNQDCNPVVSRTAHEHACRASLAAEAAGTLGGAEGYWRMHDWLMSHQEEFGDETLRQAATEMGFDVDALFAAMDHPTARRAIDEDSRAGKPMLYRGGIPTIYVNGKVIPRWRREGEHILEMILNEAYQK